MTTQDRTYSTKANAKRALKTVCKNCVKHASKIIYETEDGRFALNEDLVEQYMDNNEWQEVWGNNGSGLPAEKNSKEDDTLGNLDNVEVKYETQGMLVQQAVAAAVQKEVVRDLTCFTPDGCCPVCGTDQVWDGDASSGIAKDEGLVFGCHHCDWEVDLRKTRKPSVSTGKAREAQKTSMKLDRRIAVRYEENGEQKFEQFKNACAMWKANPSWMTSAQEDRLTKVLYAAAKKGEYATMEINGRSFCLVQI